MVAGGGTRALRPDACAHQHSMIAARTLSPTGDWAVITGGSYGLGAALAEQLARHGLHLVLVARGVDRLERLAERLRAQHSIQVRLRMCVCVCVGGQGGMICAFF